jgi:hypothetical protein
MPSHAPSHANSYGSMTMAREPSIAAERTRNAARTRVLRTLARCGRLKDAAFFDWAGVWVSAIVVALGSAAYHVFLTPASLALDRVGICGIIAFAGARLLQHTLELRPDPMRSLFLLALTQSTVLYWAFGGTAWVYGGVQAIGGVVVLVLLFRAHARGGLAVPLRPILLFLGCYAAAKIVEALDVPICEWTGVIGGHPFKHLLSALGLWCLAGLMRAEIETAEGTP